MLNKKTNAEAAPAQGVSDRNDRYLFVLLALISLLLFGLYYYYKKVINRSIPIIETAMAQEPVKKKTFSI